MKTTLVIISFIYLLSYGQYYITENIALRDKYNTMNNSWQQKYDGIETDRDYLLNQKVFTKTPVFLFPLVMADYDDISSYFGNRLYPLRGNAGGTLYKPHYAIDIVGSEGARCKLIAKARVKDKWHEAGWHYVNGAWKEYSGHGDYNGYVIFELLDQWEGWEAGYGHIASITVHENDTIEAGYEFAIINPEVDSKSTGPHTHFWLKNPSGEYVNPMNYIGKI